MSLDSCFTLNPTTGKINCLCGSQDLVLSTHTLNIHKKSNRHQRWLTTGETLQVDRNANTRYHKYKESFRKASRKWAQKNRQLLLEQLQNRTMEETVL